MERFTIGWTTIPDVADSDFLDRLADIVYDIDELSNQVLFLDDDGAVTARVDIDATDALAAIEKAATLFFDAFVGAEPLRLPRPGELKRAKEISADVARRFQTEQQARQLLSSISADLSARLPGERDNEPVHA